ncbi:preprotein translocase subunit YajC [Micrococcoides hystricis]|uniref:Preprotein translocase subunit YajC n=1 Tax=Micrococcoides hystricis TaxID=1572761 RepID=A0ABV6P9M1_9MICC
MIQPTLLTLAQGQDQAAGNSGPDFFTIILLVGAGLLLFMMFRKSKNAQAEQVKMRSTLEPGTRVMTQFGLFGEIVSVDSDNSEVILELSPGNFATVHLQTISRVIDAEEATVAAETDENVVSEPNVEAQEAERDQFPHDPQDPQNPEERR